jgi:hypothetical protein
VLTSGAVPLTILERLVDEYVAETKGRGGEVATSGA